MQGKPPLFLLQFCEYNPPRFAKAPCSQKVFKHLNKYLQIISRALKMHFPEFNIPFLLA